MARRITYQAGTDGRIRAVIDAVVRYRYVPEFPDSASRSNPHDVDGPGKPASVDA